MKNYKGRIASLLGLALMTTVLATIPMKGGIVHAASSFTDYFSSIWKLEEASSITTSPNQNWYLNSGGRVYTEGSRLKSIQGSLPTNDPWRIAYASANSRDTDNGYHPQNLLRLLTKSKWQNPEQKIYVKINKYNLSSSPERYDPNGILLFSRYVDSNNLYYAGVRVDGNVVVKKKSQGAYTTLGSTKYLPGTYNRNTNPNLIPTNKWVGVKTVTNTLADGKVKITVYIDRGWTNNWQKALEVTDSGQGGPAIKAAGYAGLRTDFMDIEADQYSVTQ